PSPTYLKLIDDLREDALNVGGWTRAFTRADDIYQDRLAGLRTDAVTAFGRDEAWFDRHFEIERGEKYHRPEPKLATRERIDLDLSGRGLKSVVGDRWMLHRGDLDLSDNELRSRFAVPEHVEGSVSLANNALRDLRAGMRRRQLVIDGNLDLSNNKNLRSLDGL